jgi:hypothetical protein
MTITRRTLLAAGGAAFAARSPRRGSRAARAR